MRILITIPTLALDYGGPAVSATRTSEAIVRLGGHAAIAWRQDGRAAQCPGSQVQRFEISEPGWVGRLARLRDAIRSFRPDIVYDFGIWRPENLLSFCASALEGRPWICSPRGMLEPWSLGHKAFKKKVAWHAYQRHILGRARALVATSDMEAAHLRQLLPRATLWHVPNGVDVPPERPRPEGGIRQALFLSRLHTKKQPELLIRLWQELDPPGWRLRLAGPADPDYRRALQRLIDERPGRSDVRLLQPVAGEEKRALLFASDLFVLPTLSENFGVAIAEGLAHGLPVITTDTTPWRIIAEQGCGWVVPPTAEAVAAALREALSREAGDLRAMGRRGRDLARAYSWESSAGRLLAYGTALCAGRAP